MVKISPEIIGMHIGPFSIKPKRLGFESHFHIETIAVREL